VIDNDHRARLRKLGKLLELVQRDVRVHGDNAVEQMKNAIEFVGADAEFRDLRDTYKQFLGASPVPLDLDWR